MLFRQLFDRESCTYTYLLADGGEALLIDPVRELVERDLQVVSELRLTLKYTVETHVHADHVTGASRIADRTGCTIVVPDLSDAEGAGVRLSHGDVLKLGSIALQVRSTPGHTAGCTTYVLPEHRLAMTGDALMVRGCGRTDFQGGSSQTLYQSVHEQIFTLPEDTQLYPGHDYRGRTVTTVAEEKVHNPRLGGGRTVETFAAIMDGLGLAYPKHIDVAVPANRRLGADSVC